MRTYNLIEDGGLSIGLISAETVGYLSKIWAYKTA